MTITPLKLARLNAGLTQFALCGRARVTAGRFSMAERSLIELTDDEKQRIARVLNADPMDLFPGISTSGERTAQA